MVASIRKAPTHNSILHGFIGHQYRKKESQGEAFREGVFPVKSSWKAAVSKPRCGTRDKGTFMNYHFDLEVLVEKEIDQAQNHQKPSARDQFRHQYQ
jgi:hypothetical protein